MLGFLIGFIAESRYRLFSRGVGVFSKLFFWFLAIAFVYGIFYWAIKLWYISVPVIIIVIAAVVAVCWASGKNLPQNDEEA